MLLYRGYPIEQLAVHCDFLDVCFLLLRGELPNAKEKTDFHTTIQRHTMVHEQMARFFQGFRRDAHPMAVLVGVVGALSAFYPEAMQVNDEGTRRALRDAPHREAAHHHRHDPQVREGATLHVPAQRPRATRRTSCT